jgi:hypothetical protein
MRPSHFGALCRRTLRSYLKPVLLGPAISFIEILFVNTNIAHVNTVLSYISVKIPKFYNFKLNTSLLIDLKQYLYFM